MAWTCFYFFKSMALKVPWQTCDNWWNSNACGYATPNGTMINGTYYNQSMVKALGLKVTAPTLNTPAEEFWKYVKIMTFNYFIYNFIDLIVL